MQTQGEAVAFSVPAQTIVDEVLRLNVDYIITVPDSIQRTLLELLSRQEKLKYLTVCTEDEAMGINAGLYAGGRNSILCIQNNGLFACLNTIKAIALDARVPTPMFVGQFGRDVTKPASESRNRAVRMLGPTLDTWGVPHYPLEGPHDLCNIAKAFERAHQDMGPAVVIIGARTS